jgi:hypothetical protein
MKQMPAIIATAARAPRTTPTVAPVESLLGELSVSPPVFGILLGGIGEADPDIVGPIMAVLVCVTIRVVGRFDVIVMTEVVETVA